MIFKNKVSFRHNEYLCQTKICSIASKLLLSLLNLVIIIIMFDLIK